MTHSELLYVRMLTPCVNLVFRSKFKTFIYPFLISSLSCAIPGICLLSLKRVYVNKSEKLEKTALSKTMLSETGYCNTFSSNFIRVWKVLKSKISVEQN